MSINKNVSILILRLVVGGAFIVHGWSKVSAMEQTIGFFGSLGFAPFLAYIVGYAEVIGGAMLVLGLYAELAAVVLAIVMVVAIYVSQSRGFSGYELPLVMLASLVSILGTGSGKYALRPKKSSN